MSHYVNVKTQIKDQAILVKALVRMGFENKVEVHDTAQNLIGYQGDTRKQKADVIIRRKHVGSASNDIGFEKQEDGFYRAHISEYDSSIGYNDDWTKKLFTYYGVEAARAEAEREGLTCIEEKDEEDRIRLRVSF